MDRIDYDKAKAFSTFVKARYGTAIISECHSNMTPASLRSDKKLREDSDQKSRFPSRLVETGWAGKWSHGILGFMKDRGLGSSKLAAPTTKPKKMISSLSLGNMMGCAGASAGYPQKSVR
jgi:hypothetical protein